MDWQDKFPASALKAGEEYYEQGLVTGLRKTEKGYEAAVASASALPLKVRIGIHGGRVTSLYCDCSASRVQRRCKHMAAVLFAADANEAFLSQSDSAAKTEQYFYFHTENIRNSMGFEPEVLAEGRKLADKGTVTLTSADVGYSHFSDDLAAEADGVVQKRNASYPLRLVFGRDGVLFRECGCPECQRRYGWYTEQKQDCVHMAGLFWLACDYLRKHELGDATDRSGDQMITMFQSQRAAGKIEQMQGLKQELVLKPRLVQKDGKFSVDFRIGEAGSRLFVIKKLSDFDTQVQNGESAIYGTSTILNHNLRNFTEAGRNWISFIREIVSEEWEYAQRGNVDAYFHREASGEVGQQISLFGKRLDDFYELAGSEALDYEERGKGAKNRGVLYCREENPQLELSVSSVGKNIFEGIELSAGLPVLLRGLQYTYYIDGQKFCRITPDFARQMKPVLVGSGGQTKTFRVGRRRLQEFYYTVLPRLQECADVKIQDAELIEKYLQPEVKFVFYLDAEGENAFCRAHAVYGNREITMMDQATQSEDWIPEGFRDVYRERETVFVVRNYFPHPVPEKDEFASLDDEAQMYRIISEGVPELLKYGEVQSTDRFLAIHLNRKQKVSVGVSLESGILNLEIASEGISQEELLEVLVSYQLKRRYHRLRNGDFLSLEEETDTYGMLSEMLVSLHIRPKDFVAGKMQIPAYRALYLDKMLEEHDEVYAARDSHFRKLIKDFRTVADSDYELPQSLQKVLRNYQKVGYQWLRTLQDGHFGGILADDMGLGKTLQVITLLLAGKEEGQKGVSLIVCPASLIYNWGEEFERFAPALSVCLVTGTQEERQKKIRDADSYDVLVTSYDLLKRDIDLYEDQEFACEVLDEAQYIKNHTTAAARSVKLIRSGTRFALTGTPIENRLSELWSIFDYLMPGFLYRYEAFKKEFETRIVRQEDEEASARLRRLVSPFILRRLKQDVLKDLPEKIEEARYARFGEKQQELYDAQVVHMRRLLAEQDPADFQKKRFEIFKELTRLRQICCDPSLCFENYGGGSAKLESCLELIDSAIEGGHRLLLFSQFTSMLAIIRAALDERGISYFELTGSTPKEKRVSMVRQFNQNDVKVFLISLKAGGTGLNLTGADVVIHYDPWWNVAVQNQATDRAHRIGQKNPVTVYKLIMKGSIEEKIEKLQEKKQNLADQIVNGESGNISQMTQEELLELLA